MPWQASAPGRVTTHAHRHTHKRRRPGSRAEVEIEHDHRHEHRGGTAALAAVAHPRSHRPHYHSAADEAALEDGYRRIIE